MKIEGKRRQNINIWIINFILMTEMFKNDNMIMYWSMAANVGSDNRRQNKAKLKTFLLDSY